MAFSTAKGNTQLRKTWFSFTNEADGAHFAPSASTGSNAFSGYALQWRLRSFADVFLMPSIMSCTFCSVSRGCIGMLNSRL